MSKCEFFGGPFHGQTLPIEDDVNVVDMLEVDATGIVAEVGDTVEVTLSGGDMVVRYTRIFNSRTPTHQFEYIGKAA